MTDWHSRFLAMAALVGSWSKDPSTKVGAVITDARNRIVSLGFNGYPRGVEDDHDCSREDKLRRTLHAEQNAILFAFGDLDDCTLYVTHPPCAHCTALLIQAGISRVIVQRSTTAFRERWAHDIKVSQDMMFEAGVAYEEFRTATDYVHSFTHGHTAVTVREGAPGISVVLSDANNCVYFTVPSNCSVDSLIQYMQRISYAYIDDVREEFNL